MKIIERIVESEGSPNQTNDLWLKASGDNVALKYFFNGEWKSITDGSSVSSDDVDRIISLTQSEYDGLPEKDPKSLYIMTDTGKIALGSSMISGADGVGVQSVVQTTVSQEDGGTNVWTITLTNGQTSTLQVKNGNQGNSGYSGAAGELEVVNNLTDGGATSALSAEMGKTLNTNVSQLRSEVNGELISLDSTTLTDGAYIDADTGNEVTNGYRSRTGFVEIIPGTTVHFNCYGTLDPQGYALYDANKAYVTGQEYHNGALNDVTLVVPDNVHYIRITFVQSTNSGFSSFYLNYHTNGISQDVETLKNEVLPIPNLVADVKSLNDGLSDISLSYDKDILTDGAYIDADNGNEVSNNYRSRTGFIEIVPGAKITFSVYGSLSQQGFALYGPNKEYVSGFGFEDAATHEITMEVPANVHFIRITWVQSTDSRFNDFDFAETKVGTISFVESAKKGTAIITDIIKYTGLVANKYYRTNNETIPDTPIDLSGTYCAKIAVKAGQKWRVYGKGSGATPALLSTTNSERTILRQFTGTHRADYVEITIAEGEAYIFVNLYQYDEDTDKIEQIVEYTTNGLLNRIGAIEDELPGEIVAATRQWFWKGKKVVVFGDSITEFRSIYSDGYGWVDRFAELSGALIYNGAIGGGRLTARRPTIQAVDGGQTELENSTRAYNTLDVVNLVKEWADDDWTIVDTNVAWLANNVQDDNTAQIQHLKDMPVENADIVIISAGSNDWHNGSVDGDNTLDNFNVQSVYGALNNIVKDILSANPKIQLFFLTPIPRYTRKGVPTFSASESYSTNDIVKYNDVDYVFTADHTPGAWNTSEVREATEIDFRRDEFSSDVVELNGRTLKQFSENEVEHIGKYHLPIVDMYDNIGFCKYNWSQYFPDNDNTHPAKGYIYFGEKVYRLIQ